MYLTCSQFTFVINKITYLIIIDNLEKHLSPPPGKTGVWFEVKES